MDKILKAAQMLVDAIKEHGATTAASARSGNRTPATTSYRGGNSEQDLVDVARRAVRLAREGKHLSKKERNVARKVIKAFKTRHTVANTNGVDVFTHNHL